MPENIMNARRRMSSIAIGASLLALPGLLLPEHARAQARDSIGVVAGQIVEATSGAPIAGVQITAVDQAARALSNASGRFRMTGLTGTRVQLSLRRLGFAPLAQEATIGEQSLTVTMTQSSPMLDQFVVTGAPGATQTRAMGNVVSTVAVADLITTVVPNNIQGMLATQVPGMNVARAGGAVGAGGNTRVRGVGSVSLTGRPLIYVDGIRVDDTEATTSPAFDRGDAPSRINDFSMEEIESIEVIKGPAAATLYGTEASNG